MSNMSYCRFENTSKDLKDCYENMDGNDLNKYETAGRRRIIRLCVDIAQDFGNEIGLDVEVNEE